MSWIWIHINWGRWSWWWLSCSEVSFIWPLTCSVNIPSSISENICPALYYRFSIALATEQELIRKCKIILASYKRIPNSFINIINLEFVRKNISPSIMSWCQWWIINHDDRGGGLTNITCRSISRLIRNTSNYECTSWALSIPYNVDYLNVESISARLS